MKRWPVIRHIRYFYHARRLNRWWNEIGSHFWLAVNEQDIQFLEDVWDGKQ